MRRDDERKTGACKLNTWMAAVLRLGMVCCLFLLGFCLPGRTLRAQASGSITMQLPPEGAGVEMTLYAVADINGDGYSLKGMFAGAGVALTGLDDAQTAEEAAEQLAAYAGANGISGTAQTVDSSGTLYYGGLDTALYLLVQTGGESILTVQNMLAPVPCLIDGKTVYDITLDPKYSVPVGAVILNKVDDAGNAVAQARFVLQKKTYITENGSMPEDVETGSDVNGRYYWQDCETELETDENGQITVSNLSTGTYRFVEVQAPDGYIFTDTVAYFAIEGEGTVTSSDGIYTAASGSVAEVSVVNERIKVTVNKVDAKGRAVSGALLVVKDAQGNALLDENGEAAYLFTSTSEPYVLAGIPAGDYILSEIMTPQGYHVSQDVAFTVSGDADAVNTVTMVDKKQTTTEKKKEKGRITVKKHLKDQHGNMLMASEAEFYVALFSDEACTVRETDVMKLTFDWATEAGVTFTDLDPDVTYYLAETDEYGTVITSMVYKDGVFAPSYPKGTAVKAAKNGKKQIAFENVFYEIPTGFYFGGELTITKKVLLGAEAYDTDETFYAGVFEDAAMTKLYGDVIALEMNGGSEMSVTIPVTIGESENDSATYYIAETDSNGVPLGAAANLEYTVSIDESVVTFSAQNSVQTVTITNTFREEEESSAEESEADQSESPSSPTTPNVKTGDDTPLWRYIGLLAAAAVALVGAAVYLAVRRRRRR